MSLLNNLQKGGGFLNDVDAVITSAKFGIYEMQDKDHNIVASPVALIVGYLVDGSDEAQEQAYSVGQQDAWGFTPDGEDLVPLKNQDGVNMNSNAGKFFSQFIDIGGEKYLESGKASALVGLQVHLMNVPVGKKKDGSDRSMVLITKINGEGPGQVTEEDAEAVAIEVLEKLVKLPVAKAGINKLALGGQIASLGYSGAKANKVLSLLTNPEFMANAEANGMCKYANGVIKSA